jgi:hypothetical protein
MRFPYCWHSGEARDPVLDVCWRCLASERDPPITWQSPWWHLAYCECDHPVPHRGWCLRCYQKLPDPVALVTKTGQAA